MSSPPIRQASSNYAHAASGSPTACNLQRFYYIINQVCLVYEFLFCHSLQTVVLHEEICFAKHLPTTKGKQVPLICNYTCTREAQIFEYMWSLSCKPLIVVLYELKIIKRSLKLRLMFMFIAIVWIVIKSFILRSRPQDGYRFCHLTLYRDPAHRDAYTECSGIQQHTRVAMLEKMSSPLWCHTKRVLHSQWWLHTQRWPRNNVM